MGTGYCLGHYWSGGAGCTSIKWVCTCMHFMAFLGVVGVGVTGRIRHVTHVLAVQLIGHSQKCAISSLLSTGGCPYQI